MSVIFEWKQEDFEKLINNCATEPVTPYILKYLPKDGRLLEAGCGSGRFVYYLNSLGYKITGLEVGDKMVDLVNQVYPHLDILRGDVRDLPFPDESFSGLLSLGVIEHIVEGMERPISEMWRVLKKGGYALVIVPSFNYIRRIKYPLGIYHIRSLAGLLKRAIISKLSNSPSEKIYKTSLKTLKKTDFHSWPALGDFYEYRLTKKQFEDQLLAAGFSIIDSVPTSQIDGVYHEFGSVFVSLKNHTFYPNAVGKWLNSTLSKIPFCHNHMHLCVVKK
ncbi:MAG: hypothetical protein A2270_07305 [Elusimicrobia bacterium RIFOXYA12_FULL_51_18]|nr:MAG: hypothetical protein A2270_07305 [Elusimicrobia bacterium RIFOXYA12_FULL_51_18]OGS28489.1 MAG: hypothetical protein A2218_05610 [Elusimicrobia bacterium RIFOXYA2_FULL_53_38]